MWPKLKPLLIILSVGLNVAFVGSWAVHRLCACSARPPAVADSGCAGCVRCPLHRELGTTELQWRQIEPLQASFRDSSRALCRHLQTLRAELIDLVAASDVDRAALMMKQEEILSQQRRMEDLVVEHLLAEKQLLTPEQRVKLFDMMRRRSGCMGGSMPVGLLGGPQDCLCQPIRACP